MFKELKREVTRSELPLSNPYIHLLCLEDQFSLVSKFNVREEGQIRSTFSPWTVEEEDYLSPKAGRGKGNGLRMSKEL